MKHKYRDLAASHHLSGMFQKTTPNPLLAGFVIWGFFDLKPLQAKRQTI
ncbi:MAG: hypothetical protein JO200_06680 [Comamonas sp.]|nr:hypothetical protein [Comamonas sp.]